MYTSTFLKLLAVIAAYFAPVASMISCVLILILFDFLTGMYASYRLKIPIVSHRLRKTIEKFVLYSTSILLGWMFQLQFAEWSNLAQAISGFIAATELLSVYENVNKITGLNILTKVKSTFKKLVK
jgi:uncharacterized membrane protein